MFKNQLFVLKYFIHLLCDFDSLLNISLVTYLKRDSVVYSSQVIADQKNVINQNRHREVLNKASLFFVSLQQFLLSSLPLKSNFLNASSLSYSQALRIFIAVYLPIKTQEKVVGRIIRFSRKHHGYWSFR